MARHAQHMIKSMFFTLDFHFAHDIKNKSFLVVWSYKKGKNNLEDLQNSSNIS